MAEKSKNIPTAEASAKPSDNSGQGKAASMGAAADGKAPNIKERSSRNSLSAWVEARLPVFAFFRKHIRDFRVPDNLNYLYTFGAILTLALLAQILTGLVVAMHYVPDINQAFASRQAFMRDGGFGWLFLPWHAVGASFFFIAAYIHLARGLYYGSHRAPRELVWLAGAAIYLTMMAIAFFGYVLVWGRMSSSAAAVMTGLLDAVPLIGPWLKETLLGGAALGQPLLSRLYVLHFLLPFILLALVGLHIAAIHYAGQNNPTGRPLPQSRTVPFLPYAGIKDLLAVCVFLLVFCWFLFYMPDYLGHTDNFIPADPMQTSPHIMPEWYFLPFYAILKAMNFDLFGIIPSTLFGIITSLAAILVLFFVPWLDRSPVYSARFRPLYRLFFWLFIADVFALGWLGACPAEPVYIAAAQAATAYYFAFFLIIMPFLPKLEQKWHIYAKGAEGSEI